MTGDLKNSSSDQTGNISLSGTMEQCIYYTTTIKGKDSMHVCMWAFVNVGVQRLEQDVQSSPALLYTLFPWWRSLTESQQSLFIIFNSTLSYGIIGMFNYAQFFLWALGIWIQKLVLSQQTLYPLSYLPNP